MNPFCLLVCDILGLAEHIVVRMIVKTRCWWTLKHFCVVLFRWERAGAGCWTRSAGIHQWGTCRSSLRWHKHRPKRVKQPCMTLFNLAVSPLSRATSHVLHPFSKRPSQSSTAGTVPSIQWLFPHSRGLARPSLPPSSSSTSGLAFCSTSELQESLARTEEEALVLAADPAAFSCIFWWEKLPLSGCRFLSFFFSTSHPIQPSTSLLKRNS